MTIAVLTGVFCAGLSILIAALLPPFEGYEVPIVALISGFTGSVLAQAVIMWRGRS
ncbi:hypothetical protein [Yoonia sp. 208BN28-4]|uniref:hypothetical protein n=1 Tax=Yoonia sp. 208BN28-4 TaxID=3126505 RepID=UPI0030A525E4